MKENPARREFTPPTNQKLTGAAPLLPVCWQVNRQRVKKTMSNWITLTTQDVSGEEFFDIPSALFASLQNPPSRYRAKTVETQRGFECYAETFPNVWELVRHGRYLRIIADFIKTR